MADTLYKKHQGLLSLPDDNKFLTWTPSQPASSTILKVRVMVSEITSLMQTLPENPNVMLKVFAKSKQAEEPSIHVFTFLGSPTQARSSADALRAVLAGAIQVTRVAAADQTIHNHRTATNTFTTSDKQQEVIIPSYYSNTSLWEDLVLQQGLLKKNPALSRAYIRASAAKPSGVTAAQFNKFFWTSRLPLLRAHAIERNQQQGEYNVLSVIKLTIEDDKVKLNVSIDQLQLLLLQHPVVQRAFDENVPKNLDNTTFWSRFFRSRLHKELKGERITDKDLKDNILDRYLNHQLLDTDDNHRKQQRRLSEAQITKDIDVHGNQRSIRAATPEDLPILYTLNSMSKRLVSRFALSNFVAESDGGGTDGLPSLSDLRDIVEPTRLFLTAQEHPSLVNEKCSESDLDLGSSFGSTPLQLLQRIREAFAKDGADQGLPTHDLSILLHFDLDSDDEDYGEDDSFGNSNDFAFTNTAKAASRDLFKLVAGQRGLIKEDERPIESTSSPTTHLWGLSPVLQERLACTHATTTEFLDYFWSIVLSDTGVARTRELALFAEAFSKAKRRIEVIANEAESEKLVEIESLHEMARSCARQFGRLPKTITVDEGAVMVGRTGVFRLMEPTINAIDAALRKHEDSA